MRKLNKKIRIVPLITLVGGPLIIIGVISLLIPNMKLIYENLISPIFAPPAIVFPFIWINVYILMGIASYKIYVLKYENVDISSSLFVYYIQLLLNFLWPLIFFGLRLYGLAFLELVLLFLFVTVTIIKFYKKAGMKVSILLFPYLIWLIYAGVLNFFIWMFNEM